MKIFILITIFSSLWFSAKCQTTEVDDPPPFDCYQVYFDEAVESVVKVEYTDSEDAIQYRLGGDGTKLILDNYKGKKRIKYSVITKSGEEKNFTKSSCFIDPCEINL